MLSRVALEAVNRSKQDQRHGNALMLFMAGSTSGNKDSHETSTSSMMDIVTEHTSRSLDTDQITGRDR